MSVAVVTTAAGRHDHLRAQRRALAAAPPDRHVVVALDDPAIGDVAAEQAGLPTVLVTHPATPAGRSVAAARNRGAAAAQSDVLVFLDVDCIPAPELVTAYVAAVTARPDALISGPVTYLPPGAGWTAATLRAARAPHAARPDPPAGTLEPLPPDLFWSLSFACSAELWHALGGFHEGYVGYGAEDTDFACVAAAQGVPVLMAGGIDAFHQHHPTQSPPRQHLDDIARNSAVFRRRHGRLPMRGWLDAFAADGLLRLDGPRRVDAPVVATVPARHPYLDAALPPTVVRYAVDRVAGWEPDPLLRPGAVRAAAPDVLHVHFGYDHLAPAELRSWLDGVDVPLVVTVHDLRNPHHPDRAWHDEHLDALLRRADHAVTLTAAAAEECARRFGRRPEVIPHPPLPLDGAAPRPAPGREILLPLKNLRANVREPDRLLRAVAAGAATAGARVRVLIDPRAVSSPAGAAVAAIAAACPGTVVLDVAPHLPHGKLTRLLAGAHACVLPYRFGTHSGWIELCRDLGVPVLAPDCGHYAAQWDGVRTFGNNERDGLDEPSLRAATRAVCAAPRPAPAPAAAREALGDLIRARHDVLYRTLAGR